MGLRLHLLINKFEIEDEVIRKVEHAQGGFWRRDVFSPLFFCLNIGSEPSFIP